MEFDKKTVLAFLLIGLVLILTSTDWYRRLVVPQGELPPVPTEVDTPAVEKVEVPPRIAAEEEPRAAVGLPVSPQDQSPVPSARPVGPSAVTEGERIPVETDLYRAVFNTRGGVLEEWTLKKYVRYDSNQVQLVAPDGGGNLAIVVPTFEDSLDTEELLFEADRQQLRLYRTRPAGQVRFRLGLGDGRVIEKRLEFFNNRYAFTLHVRLLRFGDIVKDFRYLVKWESGLMPTERDIGHDMRYAKAYVLTRGDLISQDVGDTKPVTHPSLWAAVRTKYFTAAVIPRTREALGVDIEGRSEQVADVQVKAYSFALEMPLLEKQEAADSFWVYLGPLDYKTVKSYGVGLEKMMNFGWSVIRPISIAVLLALQAMHKVIPNYGIVLILFSLLVKVIVYPLTRKSYKSMKHMQQLQPKMAELKEKYANDPQRLNRETMKLYKEHGVNPLGGCLPTLLQMPLLYALFIVFQSTIELRGAAFFAWIKDLSAPDTIVHLPVSLPFYGSNVNILPLVMGATMIWQQKMTMQDPKQKALVYLMPIMFVVLFNNFPSGLTLYYTMFNVFTIIQQKLIKDKEPAAPEGPSRKKTPAWKPKATGVRK